MTALQVLLSVLWAAGVLALYYFVPVSMPILGALVVAYCYWWIATWYDRKRKQGARVETGGLERQDPPADLDDCN